MTEIKMHGLLIELIEDAKKIGNDPNGVFTAERYLVAIIEKLEKNAGENDDEALSGLRFFSSHFIKNKNHTKEVLMTYINNPNSTTSSDEQYIEKKLHEARELVNKVDPSAEVEATALLVCIMEDPSEAIKPFVRKLKVKAEVVPEPAPYDKIIAEAIEQDIEETQAEERAKLDALVETVKTIRTNLEISIIGQENAIDTFAKGYFRSMLQNMIEPMRRRPSLTFLFAGPSGVGKTFLAEQAAEILGLPFKRFDMSEYSDKEATIEFCGSDKVYKNGKVGNVTSFVAENPKCILLFDEIEKSHLNVIHLFLQILDAGRLRDNFTDEEVSFTDTILIFTTNAGKSLYEESETLDLSSVSKKVILKSLQKDINVTTGAPYFPPSICSRFASGNIVMFNHLKAHDLCTIAKKEIEHHANRMSARTGIEVVIDERVYTAIMLSEGGNVDARRVTGRAGAFFNDELYELLRLVTAENGKRKIKNIRKINITVDLEPAEDKLKTLFLPDEPIRILVFADENTTAKCQQTLPNFTVFPAHSIESAVEIIKTKSINLVLIDIQYGMTSNLDNSLNIADADSKARDFFMLLKEKQFYDLPVYMLEQETEPLSEEERLSFVRQGVRGILPTLNKEERFTKILSEIASNIYQQSSLIKLEKENKLLNFESSQAISDDGKTATIKLFDFKTVTAVEPDDAKNILSSLSKPDVRFEDVIGAEDAKSELAYFVEYLKNPKKYIETGVKAPKGVILYGPSGTGKTMLAKAMACESDVTFIATEGNRFLNHYVGEGAKKIHDLFRIARKYSPSILFIDEIDVIAKERKGVFGGNNDEETLTALLTEMDGFSGDPTKPVFVLAATNFEVKQGRGKSLDGALMRRFDRRIYVDLPNKEERIKFLNLKASSNNAIKISASLISNISVRATGMSLAELDSVVELALRSAIRTGSEIVDDVIFEDAFETYNNGEIKKWDASLLERIARHEAGHAFISWKNGETPSYITIVARGDHGGYMQYAEREEKPLYTKKELLSRIRTSLGGRAAELVYYGYEDGISTSASADLEKATIIAHEIVCSYGMDDEFGLSVSRKSEFSSEAMSPEERTFVNRILKKEMETALQTIEKNKAKIDLLVNELLEKNHLGGSELEAILKKDNN